ncbi:MAG: DUF2069 domain-containing protein [Dokdonella sp.]
MMALRCGFIAWAALVALQLLWYTRLAPPANGEIGFALLLTLPPLLLPLLALRRGARRALLWVGIVSLGYFTHGVVVAWAEPTMRTPALIEVALCVILTFILGWIARGGRKQA